MTEISRKIKDIKKRFTFESVRSERNEQSGERRYYLTEEQIELFYDIKALFREMSWEISFQDYKELKISEENALDQFRCGTPVIIRLAKDDRTYFGILLGSIAEHPTASIDGNVVTVSSGLQNPAIFIPELKKICFGYESWWREIESPDELKDVISDEDIDNCFYMKLLRNL